MAKRFPAKRFVKVEQDGATSYFVPGHSLDELAVMGETIRIGVYQLAETTYVETIVKTSGTIKK
jgi:hypothetical protein